jgi:two-component system sensor histidine kinase BaeS
MSLRVRLAATFAIVALLTAVAVAVTAPTIVGRGFAALQAETESSGPGRGAGQGPRAGLHAQQVQQETVVTLIVVALGAVGGASLLGLWIATRVVGPLDRLQQAAAAVARGELNVRSGIAERSDEIGSLGRSFDRMAGELAASDAARRRFFQDAAHELKTPLAVIDATTSAVLDGVYAHDDRHLVTIRDQARVLARIVDDLRTISLAEAGALELALEPTRVDGLLAAAARDMEAAASARGVRIEVKAEPVTVRGDRYRLGQALAALVDNALRHAPDGGWIRLEGRPSDDGGWVVVAVTDSGPGIADLDLPHLFERFFRADPAPGGARGSSGLGLSIVRAVVEAHGGQVRAMNAAGAGARVEFALPLRHEA